MFFHFLSLFRLIKQKTVKEIDGQGVKKITYTNDPRGLYVYTLLYNHGPPDQKSGRKKLQNKKRIRAIDFTLP